VLPEKSFTLFVIFITARGNAQWQERTAETGAVAYLSKPFDRQLLLDAPHTARRILDAA